MQPAPPNVRGRSGCAGARQAATNEPAGANCAPKVDPLRGRRAALAAREPEALLDPAAAVHRAPAPPAMADDDGGAMGTTSSSQSLPPMGSGLERTTTSSGLRRTLTDARPGGSGAGAPTFARPPRAPPSGAELVSTVSNVHRKTLAAEIPFGAVIDFTNHACANYSRVRPRCVLCR
jgi:hypothetical protein